MQSSQQQQLVEAINRDPRYLLFLPDAFPHGPLAFEGSCSDQSEAASKCLHALVNLYSGQQKQLAIDVAYSNLDGIIPRVPLLLQAIRALPCSRCVSSEDVNAGSKDLGSPTEAAALQPADNSTSDNEGNSGPSEEASPGFVVDSRISIGPIRHDVNISIPNDSIRGLLVVVGVMFILSAFKGNFIGGNN